MGYGWQARTAIIGILALHLCARGLEGRAPSDDGSHPSRRSSLAAMPDPTVPFPLRDLWFRFHEAELCQGLDAVFVFHADGLEVWVLVEDEKAYQRFADLAAPLSPDYRVELYASRPTVEKKSPADRDPPPSLWNNVELRDYLQDPFARQTPELRASGRGAQPIGFGSEFFLKQRIMMFAEQVLDWERQMAQYARDLPALAEAGYGAGAPEDTRARARAVGIAHADALDKLASRLTDSLARALPRGSSKGKDAPKKDVGARLSTAESASRIAELGDQLALRIYRFIHPQQHTVAVTDLRDPTVLESLRTLRSLVSRFREASRRADRL